MSQTANPSAPEATDIEKDGAEVSMSDAVVASYAKILAEDSKQAYGKLGFALFHSIEDRAAMDQLKVLGFKPKDALDHYNRGCVLAESGKMSDAISEFKTAVQMQPGFFEAEFNLALAMENSGDKSGAKKHWNAALENAPGEEEAAEIKEHLGQS